MAGYGLELVWVESLAHIVAARTETDELGFDRNKARHDLDDLLRGLRDERAVADQRSGARSLRVGLRPLTREVFSRSTLLSERARLVQFWKQ